MIYTYVSSGTARVLVLVMIALHWGTAAGSSHREAPVIAKSPLVDGTDVYAFVAPESTDRLVLAASWSPFEAPESGPVYYAWDESAVYQIHVDNDGDAVADLTYELRAQTDVQTEETLLYNNAPIQPGGIGWNRQQRVTITERDSGGSSLALVTNVLTAPVNIGEKSTPNYAGIVQAATYSVSANGDLIQLYAGPTDDAFFADFQIFDLVTLRGQSPPIGYSMGSNQPTNSLAGHNVHTLVIELPIARLTAAGESVIGVWATAVRDDSRIAQDSRVGSPLFNKLMMPWRLKDVFNRIAPELDLSVYGDLQPSVEDPEFGVLLCALYGVRLPGDADNDCRTEYTNGTPRTGRGDIFDVYLQGIVFSSAYSIATASGTQMLPPGFTLTRPSGVVPAAMLRLNTAISGSICAPVPSPRGLLAGDICGYPNGRRPDDDVVDIFLAVMAGALYGALDGRDATFMYDSGLDEILTDGVDRNDLSTLPDFPYFPLAQSGQDHTHDGAGVSLETPIFADGFEP